MKKIILIFCFAFYILHSTFYIPTALAVDSSPSADIQSKLKDLQAEIASRAANMKNEVNKKLQNKAFNGILATKNTETLTINLKTGTGNININEFTEYIIKGKKLIGNDGLKNLAVADPFVALGDVDDKGVLTAKRIIKLTKPVTAKKVVYGIITETSKDKTVLKTLQGDQFSITFDKNTDYQLGKNDGSFDDVKTNQWIIAEIEGGVAKFVYIFPTSITVKPKVSSPSPTKK